MASKNEKEAAKLGMTLREYKASSIYKSKKAEEKSREKEEKSVKKFFKTEKEDIESQAKRSTKRLAEDLANIMKDSGIAQTRATEDFLRNIGNIENRKAADVDDINEYVRTSGERTGEDLDVALAKEGRRYQVEFDKTNQALAEAGMTFSERKQEKIGEAESVAKVEEAQRTASRSFQDIARFEAVQNRNVQLKYGEQTEEAGVKKARTMEDILNTQEEAKLREQRGKEDIAFGKAIDIREKKFEETGALTDIADTFAEREATRTSQSEILNVLGN